MTAKITVITAVLNQADAFRETAQSVFDQTYADLDYIVVDGGSSDGTLDAIREYENHLASWVSEPDEGVYDAMNKGWGMADPESFILFLGAGDLLQHLPMELPVPGTHPDVYYGRVMLDDGKEFVSHANWRLKLYNSLHHQGLLVPKKLHLEPPFNTKFRLYADFDFNQKLYKERICFKPHEDLCSYASPGGMTMMTDVREMTQIVKGNLGPFWFSLSWLGFSTAWLFPIVNRFKPMRRDKGPT